MVVSSAVAITELKKVFHWELLDVISILYKSIIHKKFSFSLLTLLIEKFKKNIQGQHSNTGLKL